MFTLLTLVASMIATAIPDVKPVFVQTGHTKALAAYCSDDLDGNLGVEETAVDIYGRAHVYSTCAEAEALGVITLD